MLTRLGQPLELYHGTCATFDTFRPLSHFGTRRAAEQILFASNNKIKPDVLSKYASHSASDTGTEKTEARIIPVYLNMDNPLPLSDFSHTLRGYQSVLFQMMLAWQLGVDSPLDYSARLARRYQLDNSYVFFNLSQRANFMAQYCFMFNHPWVMSHIDVKRELWLGDLYPLTDNENKNRENLILQRMIRFLESFGYDGITYLNEIEDTGHQSYIIFRPGQVVRLDETAVNKEVVLDADKEKALDVIRQKVLSEIKPTLLSDLACMHVYYSEGQMPQFSYLGKPQGKKQFWMRFALKRITSKLVEQTDDWTAEKQERIEQTAFFGIDYALTAHVRPLPVILGAVLNVATERMVPAARQSFVKNFLMDSHFDLNDVERAQILDAVCCHLPEHQVINDIDACVFDAVHTLSVWQGKDMPVSFLTPYAKRVAAFTPQKRQLYLEKQIMFLNKQPRLKTYLTSGSFARMYQLKLAQKANDKTNGRD